MYVTEHSGYRVQKFTPFGSFITKWATLGSGNGQFNVPYGIAVASNGNVYVADQLNHRVQVFGQLPVPTLSTSWGRIKQLFR